MPFACAIEFSSGVVMKPATSEGSAPKYVVVTVTTAFSVRGYCSTGSSAIERSPSTSSVRLTTVARTGRSTKISVNFLMSAPSLILGLGRGVVRGLDRVVHDHRHARTQLDLPGRHHGVAFLDSGENRDLVSAGRSGGDELLLCHQRARLAVHGRLLLHDEYRVAVRVVAHRGLWKRDAVLRLADGDTHRREHPRKQRLLRIAHRRAHEHVARGRVDLGVDRADLSDKLLPGKA